MRNAKSKVHSTVTRASGPCVRRQNVSQSMFLKFPYFPHGPAARVTGALLLLIAFAGCYEPPYRYEVHSNGQGSVQVDTVPKAPDAPQPVVSSPPPAVAPPTGDQQQQIDALKARVRELSIENEKLKQHPPTTGP